VLNAPINGRITSLTAIQLDSKLTSLLFITTDQHQYAIIGYDSQLTPHYIRTYASGSLKDEWNTLGQISECGPLVTIDPYSRCIVLHLYDGLVTVFPIRNATVVAAGVFHARLEERTVLAMTVLHHLDPIETPPHLCVLHQDSRGNQHVTTHVVDLHNSQVLTQASYSSRLDGGSSLLIPKKHNATSGGVVVLGQRQITYCARNYYKVLPIPPALILSWDALPPDASGMTRYLLGDEFGNLHMLTLITAAAAAKNNKSISSTGNDNNNKIVALQLDTLGSCTLTSCLQYLDHGLVFCGSQLGDSQLVQIHDKPIPVEDDEDDNTTFLSVIEEYTHLGPIVDFDLVPMAGMGQSQVVTASGSSKSGSLRVIRNGIGMKEYANVELSGIQSMWNLRGSYEDDRDSFLVQSFVGETRVLGVISSDEQTGDDDVVLPGLESNASTLHISNIVGNLFLQVTETELRLVTPEGEVLDTFNPNINITVAAGNEAGQTAVALTGGKVIYFEVDNKKLIQRSSKQMDREVSCLNMNPFLPEESTTRMDGKRRNRNNMMARSLCLITLDFSSSSESTSSSSHGGSTAPLSSGSVPGVNMLLVGLGDGTLVSFAVIEGDHVRVQSKKEVSLGTQRINLIPLKNGRGGNCVLATGDRPTVIYLAGMGGASGRANYNPKLCYSNVNLSPIDDGDSTPFCSPLLFDDTGNEHYSLCVADDSNLRLGIIDDIQKLHVTTYRLGMAPRRVVRCSEGRMFAVGCIESGIKELGIEGEQMAMGNCIRFLDDSTFEDIHRIDLEPTEMILSMSVVGSMMQLKSYLVVGTAYVLHDEDEPTKGRILVYSCNPEDNPTEGTTNRSVKLVTELQVRGGVYSISQFFNGKILATVNSKTQLCEMMNDGTGVIKLSFVGVGHHGHILSLFVSNREMLAIVGDLMRSISLVQYYPQYETLEEVARDFNANWTTAVTMLTDDVYLGGENWNNLFVLRRNTKAQSEEVRCRLETVGEFHLGEMCNKFMSGSLVMPNSSSDTPVVAIGSQTLFGTADGTLGVILGLDNATAAFFSCLEKAMEHVIMPIGNFSHEQFRSFSAEQRINPRHGFVDGDLVESFLDFDMKTMELVVQQMN
ncbi:CPSF_A-domain-containing protein, partial [Fragilariopsis cylindrus CCMP1102]